jgi:hypothetical protein
LVEDSAEVNRVGCAFTTAWVGELVAFPDEDLGLVDRGLECRRWSLQLLHLEIAESVRGKYA